LLLPNGKQASSAVWQIIVMLKKQCYEGVERAWF